MRDVEKMFSSIDKMDVAGFAEHLSEHVVFQFGNAPELHGREAVATGVAGFFGQIAGLRHVPTGGWELGEFSFRRFMTYYKRLDGPEVSAPCAVVLHHEESGLIDDYRIYIDLSPVFAKLETLPETSNA
ncbi:nuclear transport factor 2 family protein [Burkholderia multivorans]|uniref:nuclear transport factor 2 family protein n=1 Tax=Burkholderia multivorans TaxID=87883 RepID=UPI001C227A58|nr:nuclear transport factor 2 family protein [Burkholderia multivorans]MBU9212389.1 nuclear transport factor 2 family protein [Burkholderia multivorans]